MSLMKKKYFFTENFDIDQFEDENFLDSENEGSENERSEDDEDYMNDPCGFCCQDTFIENSRLEFINNLSNILIPEEEEDYNILEEEDYFSEESGYDSSN